VENSPMLTSRGLGTVLGDLSEMGFDAEWGVLSAADVGANHKRERIWICAKQREFLSYSEHDRYGWGEQQSEGVEKKDGTMANSKGARTSKDFSRLWKGLERVSRGQDTNTKVASSNGTQCEGNKRSERVKPEHPDFGGSSWWSTEPNVGRVANGVAARVVRLKAIGNGQVPLCAATAFKLLKERLNGAEETGQGH